MLTPALWLPDTFCVSNRNYDFFVIVFLHHEKVGLITRKISPVQSVDQAWKRLGKGRPAPLFSHMSATSPRHSYAKNSAYRSLAAPKIIDTAAALKGRISDRFPNAGLNKIARELEVVAMESAERAAWCAQPQWQIRGPAIALAIGGIIGVIAFLSQVHLKNASESLSQLLQDIYNVLNDTILFVIGLVFLWGWERRIKRARALKAMHELRSLAHIIDMHQVTKDHESLFTKTPTEASAKGLMTNQDLIRYLIFCGDLLALLGKIAALYAQELEDSTVLNAVTEIETLTTALSQKIWQRITLVEGELTGKK